MKQNMKRLQLSVLLAGSVALMAGCANNAGHDDKAHHDKNKMATQTSADLNNQDIYATYDEDGRLYLFDDQALFLSFQKLGETPFTLNRIGAGPKGETIRFGLRKQDKKKHSDIAVIDMWDGKLAGAEDFYGEMISEGRFYAFNNLEDFKSTIKTGEATFRYTDIGSGPKGETVVYVLNKHNKKKKPTALIETFKSHH